MSKKHEAINTINAEAITLTDTDLETLDSIVKHWNVAHPADPPLWDPPKVLAELARLTLVTMRSEYGPTPRKPNFSAPPPPEPPQPLEPEPPIG